MLAHVLLVVLLVVAFGEEMSFDESKKDAYYEWFGMTRRDFDAEHLRRAYLKLTKKYHPDKNDSPDADETFYKISHAFDVLNDDQKRAQYDMGGASAVKDGASGSNTQSRHNFAQDIFERFFNAQQNQRHRGPDTNFVMEAPLENFFSGRQIEFTLNRRTICRHCSGSGADDAKGSMETCSACRGAGAQVVHRQLMPGIVQQMQIQCPQCNGEGKIVKKACRKCHGERMVSDSETLELQLQPGDADGRVFVFEGKSEERVGLETGDLHVIVKCKDSARFRRDGDHLYTFVDLTLAQALLGFNLTIDDPVGAKIEISRSDVTQNAFVDVIDGMGMPVANTNGRRRGDLYVEYRVALPTNPSDELKRVLLQESATDQEEL